MMCPVLTPYLSLPLSGDQSSFRMSMAPACDSDGNPLWVTVAGIQKVLSFACTAGRNGRPRMLVVDDEDGPRVSVQIVFRDQFDVLAVDSSELALVACALRCFDIAISDIRRAGMSGLDCLEVMRRMGWNVPVLLLTAYAPHDRLRRALALGASAVIHKPFAIQELRHAVALALHTQPRK